MLTSDILESTEGNIHSLTQGLCHVNAARHGMQETVRLLARTITHHLPDIEDAVVAAIDCGEIVAIGTDISTLELDPANLESFVLEAASKLPRRPECSWLSLDVQPPLLALKLAPRVPSNGVLVVKLASAVDRQHNPSLRALEQTRNAFSDIIKSLYDREELTLNRKVQHLIATELCAATFDARRIAHGLTTAFQTDSATIFIHELGSIHLAASTDPKLDESGGIHAGMSIEGGALDLNSYIFRQDTSVRLKDLNSWPEIEKKTQERIRDQSELQESLASSGEAVRCLACPVRFSNSPNGIVRLLRRQDATPFTSWEEETLKFFSEVLGSTIERSWGAFIRHSIVHSETEAVLISRNDDGTPTLVFAESGAKKFFGYKTLEGVNAQDLYADGEYARVKSYLRQTIKEKKSICGPFNFKGVTENGTPVSGAVSFRLERSPFTRRNAEYTVALIRDTAKSAKEQDRYIRIRDFLEDKGLAYFMMDFSGHTRESSAADLNITGYSQDELMDINRDAIFIEKNRYAALLNRIKSNKGKLVRDVQRIRCKDGSFRWIEGDFRALEENESARVGIEGLYEDVTDRVRLQGFLDIDDDKKRVLKEHDLYKLLERKEQFHLNFMTSVSHQLRTPLGALVATLENIQEGVVLEPDQVDHRINFVIGQAKVCSLLVENLTYMDKLLRNETFKLSSRVDLAKLIADTKSNLDHLLRDKRIGIIIDGANIKDHFGSIKGHKELLRQVIVNLIDNAIKYSKTGTLIKIRSHDWPQGLYLDISNAGLPIPKVHRGSIFERGFRLPKAQYAVPDGTGLGLWLVRKILEVHGATISCIMEQEDGENRIVFRIRFPPDVRNQAAA